MNKKAAGRLLTIRIVLESPLSDIDLKLRHTLADTLEDRGIGEVVDEGSCQNYMEIALSIDPSEHKESSVRSLLQSLGLFNKVELFYGEPY
jgi:hypothetical protein